jgi:YVTN family beta-propeller protein
MGILRPWSSRKRQKSVYKEVTVGTQPLGIAVPDDRFVYVATMEDDTILVIDLGRGTVARTSSAGDEPHGIAFFPDRKQGPNEARATRVDPA